MCRMYREMKAHGAMIGGISWHNSKWIYDKKSFVENYTIGKIPRCIYVFI